MLRATHKKQARRNKKSPPTTTKANLASKSTSKASKPTTSAGVSTTSKDTTTQQLPKPKTKVTPQNPSTEKIDTNSKPSRYKKKPQDETIELSKLTVSTLPTPYSIQLGEQLQEEEDKQLRDSKAPLRSSTATGFSFDLPQMSRIHVPSAMNIKRINKTISKITGNENLLLPSPEQAIPNWDKLTVTEQLLLNGGFIGLVPGSSQYSYLPMATRVLEKLTNIITDELLSQGHQRVEIPGILEKKLLDNFQTNRQRLVLQNEAIHGRHHANEHRKALFRQANNDEDSETIDGSQNEIEIHPKDVSLAASIYDHPLSPYYRFYNLQDDELLVSPPNLDYYTALVKGQIRLASQLPLALYQLSKKFRDISDSNAILNSSTNISEANKDIGYLQLNNKAQQNTNHESPNGEIAPHPNFAPNSKSHQTETLMNSLITSTEYQSLNVVTYHHDVNDAHNMYKQALDLFTNVFKKLNVRGVQVQADGTQLGAELSHEYHLVVGATSEAPQLKKDNKPAERPIPTNTHALVQCGLCNYTANTENAQFGVSDQFDQSSYNSRMKSGDLTLAMRKDPRSFGIFEPTGGEPQFDRDIRSKVTGLVKQMMPNLARRDVPMVANIVKLVYGPGQDGFYDLSASTGEDLIKNDMQFVNHVVLMIRADREYNPRSVARHFGCHQVESLSAAESALLLLKFQKYKQKQYQDLVTNGVIEVFDPNFNIFSELVDKTLSVDARDVDEMYENMDSTTLIEKEQRRLRRLAARRDANAGLVIVCDNTLVAQGIDLDDESSMSQQFLNEDNTDRSFSLKLVDGKQGGNNQAALTDRLGGYQNEQAFQASQHVPPEFAEQFNTIFKGIQQGILQVGKNGELTLNDIPDNIAAQYPEFLSIPADETVESYKKKFLAGEIVDLERIDTKSTDEETDDGTENSDDRTENSDEISDYSTDELSDLSADEITSMLAPKSIQDKDISEIFESAMKESKARRVQEFMDENRENDDINMFEDEHGNYVDAEGQVLPHITSDLIAGREVRRAFGKHGYDKEDDEFSQQQGTQYQEQLLATINPSHGDFASPQSGDKCLQQACHAQGILEGLRSIEIGKLFFLSDSITRNTDALIINNKPNRFGDVSNKAEPMHMTSSKIGLTRLMHALVEAGGNDQYGIKWPELIAPYQIAVITDPTPAVNFSKQPTKTLNKYGVAITKQLDVFEAYTAQTQLAREAHEHEVKEHQDRLKQLKATPGITPALDKQRNTLIADAENLLEGEDYDDAFSNRLEFGHWSWGLADNHNHTLNVVSTLVRNIGTLEDDIVYDDRHELSVDERIQDVFSMGIPWVVIVDDMMQEKGLLKVVNRAKQQMEYLSVDQLVHFFAGQRPLHQRPEHVQTEFERSMKFRVENALMSHFGNKAIHEGDTDFFRLKSNNNDSFDYNTHVDIQENHDEEYDKMTTPRFDDQNQVVNPQTHEAMETYKAQTEAIKTGDVSNQTLKKTGVKSGAAAGKSDDLLQNSIEEAIQDLNAKGGTEPQAENEDSQATTTPGKAIDEWYHQLKELRRRLPSPTPVELDRMFRTGILYKDQSGDIQVNMLRAHQNPHVILGVDPHVLDQFETGNVIELDRTGQGVRQVIDKHEYLQQQRDFTARRIEKQIESGFFDLAITQESRGQLQQKAKDYYDWQTQQSKSLAKTSIFAQIKYEDPHQQFHQLNEQRRQDLQANGVKFRSIRDGSAVIQRPSKGNEAHPFDTHHDVFSNNQPPPQSRPLFSQPAQVVQQPLSNNMYQQQPKPQQQPPQQPQKPPQAQYAYHSLKKTSLSSIFDKAPVLQTQPSATYDEIYGSQK